MRKRKRFYYLYQIENVINGMIYVGVHQTDNLEDGYMGSGSALFKAKQEFGRTAFKKTILQFFETEEDMMNAESCAVNSEFLARNDVYNKIRGGLVGRVEVSSLGGKTSVELKKGIHDPTRKEEIDFHRRKSGFNSKRDKRGICNPEVQREMTRRAATPEAIRKRKETMRARQHSVGERNSQYGTIWISNSIIGKTIKIKELDFERYRLEGWLRGRLTNKS